MAVHLQISFYLRLKIKKAVLCKSAQHMVKESDPRMDGRLPCTVKIQCDLDIRLLRRSSDTCFSLHKYAPPYSKRTLIELAWAVRCSAAANCSISSWMHSRASLEYAMILDFLIKSSTDSGEKNLAVPFVGST